MNRDPHLFAADAVRFDRPGIDELVARARAFQPLLREQAGSVEAERRVSARVIQELSKAGLMNACKPRRFGGYEYGPSAMLRIGFELGQACGSTAWCTMIASCNAWFVAYWPLDAQADVWGSQPDNLVAGTVVPTGRCEKVEGGYLVSGQWPFASNCENSDWLSVAALLPEVDGVPQGPGWFLTPAETLSVDQSSWFVSGMQGTGSKTIIADKPIFVPDHRVIRFQDTMNGKTPGTSIDANPLAHVAFSTYGAAALVAPLLGMAQGALDWFSEAMRTKKRVAVRPGAPATAADNPFTQERAGRASAGIAAAMALLMAELERSEAKAMSGTPLTVEERVNVRRAFGFGARQAVEAVNLLADGAGASSNDSKSPMQRFWKDINAGARHVSMDANAIYSMVGQNLFGMTPMGGF